MIEQRELETAIENIGECMRRAYEEGLKSVRISMDRPVMEGPSDGPWKTWMPGNEVTISVTMHPATELVPWANEV